MRLNVPAIKHRNALICPRPNGTYDVLLKDRWFVRSTLRSAKWWVAVFQRYHECQQ